MATPPFLPDETKPGASDLISLYPSVEQTFRDVIEDWLLIEHNTNGTHKQVTLDDISEPTIAADLVGLWHESGVLKTRFATGTVYDVLTSNTGLKLSGGTMTGLLVLSGNPTAALGATTKQQTDLKAALASPALTGNPTAPTQSAGNDSTRLASTAFVATEIAAIPLAITRKTAIATTSGTAHGFTSIAAGANRITVMLNGVSLTGSSRLLIQLGDSGGYENTNYISEASSGTDAATATEGFVLHQDAGASAAFNGLIVLSRIDGDTWVSNGNLTKGGSNVQVSSGTKTLSGELDRIQLTRTGSSTFDAGIVNILIE